MGLFGAIKSIGKGIGKVAGKVGGVAIDAAKIGVNVGLGQLAGATGINLTGILFDGEQDKVDKSLELLQAAAGLDLSGDVLGMAGLLEYFQAFPPPSDSSGSGGGRTDWMNAAAISLNLYKVENAIGDFKFDSLDVFKRYVQAWEKKNASAGAGTPSQFIDSRRPGNGNRTTSFANHMRRLGATKLREMDARLFGRTIPGFAGGSARPGSNVDGSDFVDGLSGKSPLNAVTISIIVGAIVAIVLLARKG